MILALLAFTVIIDMAHYFDLLQLCDKIRRMNLNNDLWIEVLPNRDEFLFVALVGVDCSLSRGWHCKEVEDYETFDIIINPKKYIQNGRMLEVDKRLHDSIIASKLSALNTVLGDKYYIKK